MHLFNISGKYLGSTKYNVIGNHVLLTDSKHNIQFKFLEMRDNLLYIADREMEKRQ